MAGCSYRQQRASEHESDRGVRGALFEYLALQLSPATPDDGLLTVELNRAPDGSTMVQSSFQPYVEDRAFEPA